MADNEAGYMDREIHTFAQEDLKLLSIVIFYVFQFQVIVWADGIINAMYSMSKVKAKTWCSNVAGIIYSF